MIISQIKFFAGPHDYQEFANEVRKVCPGDDSQECPCEICRISGHFGPILAASSKGRPRKRSPSPPCRLCADCFNSLMPGKPHQCSKKHKRENLRKLVSPKTSQILAIDYIENLKKSGDSKEAQKLIQAAAPFYKVKIHVEKINELRIMLGLSYNKTVLATQFLRSIDGIEIEENADKKIRETGHELKDFFEVKTLNFVKKTEMKKE